jgi:hypothetical protein
MKGIIADSITIRVGHGILTIPRQIDETLNGKNSSIQPEQIKEPIEEKEQTPNDSE